MLSGYKRLAAVSMCGVRVTKTKTHAEATLSAVSAAHTLAQHRCFRNQSVLYYRRSAQVVCAKKEVREEKKATNKSFFEFFACKHETIVYGLTKTKLFLFRI